MNERAGSEIRATIEEAIAEGRTPGAVCLVGRGRDTLFHEAIGHRSPAPERLPMEPDTVFDVASLTKVVATTTVILQLAERGDLSIDDPVERWLPEFTGEGRERATLRHLLTHSAGLPAYRNYLAEWGESIPEAERRGRVVRDICALPLQNAPGEGYEYTCLGFILLASIGRAASGRPLEELARERIFAPLGMSATGFCPAAGTRDRCAATEQLPDGPLVGVVHDENARYLSGVGGNAGLFSSAPDLARFARAILNGGELDGTRILSEESVAGVLTEQPGCGEVRRTLGWRLANADDTHLHGAPTAASVGHTGYTGTSLWVDARRGVFVILLTNRVHLGRAAEIGPLRRRVGEIVVRVSGNEETR